MEDCGFDNAIEGLNLTYNGRGREVFLQNQSAVLLGAG
jgi:hypothetical protein